MDSHQREMWVRMRQSIDSYRKGTLPLAQLVENLRGLYVEADPHDQAVRDEFELHWSPLDGVLELRTQPWAPAGAADDRHLASLLEAFGSWVDEVVAADPSQNHG